MKTIILLVPALVAGAIRYPSEGPIPVRNGKEADNLVDLEMAEIFEDDDDLDLDAGENLEKMKVEELKGLAAEEGVDLGNATKKAEIIAAILEARAGKES